MDHQLQYTYAAIHMPLCMQNNHNAFLVLQLGDPLGSTPFAATIQPILIKIATTFDTIVVTAYADNVVFSGPMSQVC